LSSSTYLTKHLCTTCRIAMSRSYADDDREFKCGRCGSPLSYVHHKFRAPPRRNVKFWNVIKFLEDADQIRLLNRGYIPRNMIEAKAMVSKKIADSADAASPQKRFEVAQKQKRVWKTEIKRRRAINKRRRARLSRTGNV